MSRYDNWGVFQFVQPESRTRITVVLDSRISYLPSPFYARTTRADASKSIGSSKEVKIQPFTRSIGMSREYGSNCVINCTSKTSHFRHKSQHDKILMWIRHPASEPARIFVNKLSAILFLCKSLSFQSILDETKWPISTSSPDLTSLSTLVHRNNSANGSVCYTRPTIFAKAQEAHTKSLSPIIALASLQ